MNESKLSYKNTIIASCISYVVQAIVNNFMPLLFLTFRSEFGLSLGKISALIGINFLVQLIMDLICTKAIDKIGYRTSILIGHVFACIGLLGLAFLPFKMQPFTGLLISTVLCAIGGGIIEVLVSPMVEAAPTENKEGTMSLLHSFYCWGQMLVILISSAFFVTLGIGNWRILAAVWAFIPALNMLYFLFVPIYKPVEKGEGLKTSDLLASSAFWVLFILMFCAGAAELSMSQWASAFAESSLHISKTVGDIVGPCLFAASMGVARLLYSLYSDRIKLQRFMVYSGALCVFAYILAIVSGSAFFSLLGVILVGFSVGIMWPGTYSLAAAKIPTGGTALFALLAFAGDIGCSAGPTLVGIVAGIAKDNLKIGLIVAIVFPLILVLTLMLVNRKLASRIVRNRGVWMACAVAVVIIALSVSLKGCNVPGGAETTPTPTTAVLDVTKTPVPDDGNPTTTPENTPPVVATETPTPAVEATETPVPTEAPVETKAPTNTPVPEEGNFEGVTIKDVSKTVYTTSGLNMRKGPGTQYDKVLVAKENEALKVTGECSNGWLRVEKEGKTLYVSGYYTTEVEPSEQTPTPTPTKKPEATATPVPTEAPEATATPEPTKKPEATSTPVPTKAPVATDGIEAYSGFTGIAYVVVDAETGDVLVPPKNANVQLRPASLTKMMTALVAVESGMDLSTLIPYPIEAMRWQGYTDPAGNEIIKAIDKDMDCYECPIGTELTLEDWLNVMLLLSAADAADTIAVGVGGDINTFVNMMNAKAQALGMTDTHFDNPVGADQSSGFYSTYSSAADMAKLAVAVLNNPTLRKIVGSASYVNSTGYEKEGKPVKNINLLISNSDYKSDLFTCTGLKTGFTDDAGQCLAAAGRNTNGTEYIVVALGVDSRKGCAEQVKKMLEYMFINY